MELSEQKQLIARSQKDPQAFGAIFEEYYEPILGYALKRTGNVHASQDIVSETFFKALDRLWQFRWRNISIASWLYRIATNEINQYFRKERKRPHSLEALFEQSGVELRDERDLMQEILAQEQELARAEEWARARALMRELPEKYQEVLSLRFFEDKKISEIAEILGKREGTVKSLLSRGTAQLRSGMAEAQRKAGSGIVGTEAVSRASKES